MTEPDDITWILSAEDAKRVELALEEYADRRRWNALDSPSATELVAQSQAAARLHSEFVNLRHGNGQ